MELSNQQQYMLKKVPIIFQTFMTSFFLKLHNRLFEHFDDASFRNQYMEAEQLSIAHIQEVIDQYAMNADFISFTDVSLFDEAKDAYLEIANHCAEFQKKASTLIAEHFPDQYPDYFLNTASTIQQLKVEKSQLENFLESIIQQFEYAKEEFEKEKQVHDQQKQQAQDKINQLSEELLENQRNIEEEKRNVEILKHENINLVEQLQFQTNSNEKLLKDLENQRQLLQDKVQKEEALKEKINDYTQKNEILKNELNDVYMQLDEMKFQCQQLEVEIEQLQQQLVSTQNQLIEKNEFKHKYDKLLDKQTEMLKQLEKLEKEKEITDKKNELLTHQHTELEQKKIYIEQEKQALNEKCEIQQKEIMILNEELEKYKNQLQQAAQQLKKSYDKYKELAQQKNHSIIAEHEKLKNLYEKVTQDEQQLKTQISQLNTDLAQKQQENMTYIIENEELKDKVRRMREQLTTPVDGSTHVQQSTWTLEKQQLEQEIEALKEKTITYKQAFLKEATNLEQTINKSQQLAIDNERLTQDNATLLKTQSLERQKQKIMLGKITDLEEELAELRNRTTSYSEEDQLMIFQALDEEKLKVQKLEKQLNMQKTQDIQQDNYIKKLHKQISDKDTSIEALEKQVDELSKNGFNKLIDKIPFGQRKETNVSSNQEKQIQLLRKELIKYIEENKFLKKQLKHYE